MRASWYVIGTGNEHFVWSAGSLCGAMIKETQRGNCEVVDMWYVHTNQLHKMIVNNQGINIWDLKEMVNILQATFWVFSRNIFILIKKIHWSLFPLVLLTISQQWFRVFGSEQVTSHYLSQWWPCSLRHIIIRISQWVEWWISKNDKL